MAPEMHPKKNAVPDDPAIKINQLSIGKNVSQPEMSTRIIGSQDETKTLIGFNQNPI